MNPRWGFARGPGGPWVHRTAMVQEPQGRHDFLPFPSLPADPLPLLLLLNWTALAIMAHRLAGASRS